MAEDLLKDIDKIKKYRNTVEFEVSAPLAMFSDVVTRAGGEKYSYPVPTYEALKGILQSVYFKPTIVWHIDAVRVMNPIRRVRKGIRPIKYSGGNDLAYYTYLCDVRYQVCAHFEWNMNRPELACDRNENKHHNIAKRMIARGGRRDTFAGTRECFCEVSPCVFGEGVGVFDGTGEIDLGYMYNGITYADEAVCESDKGMLTVRFAEVVMKNGIIVFMRPEDFPENQKRHIRPMEIKKFGKEQNNFIGLEEFEELEGGGAVELGK